MKAFGPDFYNITDLLSEEELLIQRTAYEFVQKEFMPLIHEHYEKGTFPLAERYLFHSVHGLMA